jgi:hypothetical protein
MVREQQGSRRGVAIAEGNPDASRSWADNPHRSARKETKGAAIEMTQECRQIVSESEKNNNWKGIER